MGWGEIIKAVNTDINEPLNYLLWIEDLAIFGEESYVYNQEADLLRELMTCSLNLFYQDVAKYYAYSGASAATFLSMFENSQQLADQLNAYHGVTTWTGDTADAFIGQYSGTGLSASFQTAYLSYVNSKLGAGSGVGAWINATYGLETSSMDSLATITAVCADSAAMAAICADTFCFTALMLSTTFTAAVAASSTAMGAILAASSTVYNLAFANSTIAAAIAGDSTSMATLFASGTLTAAAFNVAEMLNKIFDVSANRSTIWNSDTLLQAIYDSANAYTTLSARADCVSISQVTSNSSVVSFAAFSGTRIVIASKQSAGYTSTLTGRRAGSTVGALVFSGTSWSKNIIAMFAPVTVKCSGSGATTHYLLTIPV